MKITGTLLVAGTAIYPAAHLMLMPGLTDTSALFSQGIGMAALVLMAWGQILATRIRALRVVFGKYGQVYALHKWAGIAAMVALLLHNGIDPELRSMIGDGRFSDIAEGLGEFSFNGLLILVGLSMVRFIPYRIWKMTHKAMGAFFALGALHFFFIPKPFGLMDPVGLFTGLFCLAGMMAYAWTLTPPKRRPSLA